ncbi:CRISPR-associated endoribonuclease Cas6 [Listeria weihenstephanensis]|uniref:CRISPR-associated endoribonuclease Cas6 n=1 Tax=Listeria weihenstephanensis TaxID=1006155 RepID=A0A841Z4G0_9LIST|nr:CRISPR-associated endoribonuclease Cas6 [Listeria weihenstephanensis]MBC1499283.1 CRISPR-associated endoribonuclease Cas6 [Listeria weihenstephanensis]
MRLKISCELTSDKIPADYRRKVVSVMKAGLSKSNEEKYKEMYSGNKQKNFTFSVYLPKPVFNGTVIELEQKKLVINFATADAELGINYYNALMNVRNKLLPFSTMNQIRVKDIKIVREEPIVSDRIAFKTLSPIVCRDHNKETRKDWFYWWEEDAFEAILKRNLYFQLRDKFGEYVKDDIEALQFKKVAIKKTVVVCYNLHVACSLGKFELVGQPYLLNHFVQGGIGSMRGMGFGMIETI